MESIRTYSKTPTAARNCSSRVGRDQGLGCVSLALEVTLTVQQEMQARLEEVDRLRKKQVERARYEADLAQRRYLHVDPANRLVADSLEAEWNNKLRALNAAQQQYEEQHKKDRAAVSDHHATNQRSESSPK